MSEEPEDLVQTNPYIRVLQTGSRAVNAHEADYVSGAEAGDILVSNAGERSIVKGEAGIVVSPLGSRRQWIERDAKWGSIIRHDQLPTTGIEIQQTDDDERYVRIATGHVIEETKELLLGIDGTVYTLACRSTMLTFARTFNNYFLRFRDPTTDAPLPAFARRYRLVTVARSNGKGHWFTLRHLDLGWAAEREFREAAGLFNAIQSEVQRAASRPVAVPTA